MKAVISIFLFLLMTVFVSAQSDSLKIYQVELVDDTELTGYVLFEDKHQVSLRTIAGLEIIVQRDLIIEMDEINGYIVDDKVFIKDPNQTRLFFAPTARTLEAGSGYFSVYEIFFPTLAFSVADFLTISGGMSLIPGVEKQLFYFAPKIGHNFSENFFAAAGFMYMGVPGEFTGGIAFSVFTVGSEKAAFTGGSGIGFSENEISDSPIILLGGELRVSRTIKLISENWIFTAKGSNPLNSFGIRFFGQSLAADFGLITSIGADWDGFPFVPWVGIVYNF